MEGMEGIHRKVSQMETVYHFGTLFVIGVACYIAGRVQGHKSMKVEIDAASLLAHEISRMPVHGLTNRPPTDRR